jgi:hypothetical protein
MRKLLLIMLVCAIAPLMHAQTPPLSTYHTITEQWGAPASWNGTGTSVPCSSTITSFCVSGYTETLTPPPGSPIGPILLTPSGVVYSWSPSAGGALYCGTWNVSIVANWLDGSGQPVSSSAITGSTIVPCPFTPSPATGPVTGKLS